MMISGVSMVSRVNPYVGKPRIRPVVDEYSQEEKRAETFGFANVLDAEIARQVKEKNVYDSIVKKKKARKVKKI